MVIQCLSFGLSGIVVLLFLATTISAKSFSPSKALDQANDGDFCNSIYSCELSVQELSLLDTQDDNGYQIIDHTNTSPNGSWPQIHFAPDRYIKAVFSPNFSPSDTILSSEILISHQLNQSQGVKGIDYDIKLESSKDSGLNWETLSTTIYPIIPNVFSLFKISLPSNYLNTDSLNNLQVKLSIYGDDGYSNLYSIIDYLKLNTDYFNPQTNTSPTNTVNIPNENQVLKSTITFDVLLTDDFGIVEYQLNLTDENKKLLSTCLQDTISSTTSITISCQVNTSTYQNGQYYLQVKSKDNAGEWTTTDRSVIFDNLPPVTDIPSLLPFNTTYWKDPVTISGTTKDNLVTSFVDLYFKKSNTANPWTNLTTLVNSVTSSIFNWSYSWDPSKNNNPGEGTFDLAISATDTAGNLEGLITFGQDTAFVPSLFPIISNQKGTTPSFGEIKVSWDTQISTSGQVVYDTISHPTLDSSLPNYGYAFSTTVINTSPQATSHSLSLTNLSDTTIYYYRIISTSTPTTVGEELSNKTLSQAGPGGNTTQSSPPEIFTQSTLPTPPQAFPVDLLVIPLNTNTNTQVNPPEDTTPLTPTVTTQPPEEKVLGTTNTQKPKTWMLVLSIFISISYLAYLLSRRR